MSGCSSRLWWASTCCFIVTAAKILKPNNVPTARRTRAERLASSAISRCSKNQKSRLPDGANNLPNSKTRPQPECCLLFLRRHSIFQPKKKSPPYRSGFTREEPQSSLIAQSNLISPDLRLRLATCHQLKLVRMVHRHHLAGPIPGNQPAPCMVLVKLKSQSLPAVCNFLSRRPPNRRSFHPGQPHLEKKPPRPLKKPKIGKKILSLRRIPKHFQPGNFQPKWLNP